MKVNAVHLLLLAAVASPLLALLSTQDPASHDWSADLDKACRSNRLQFRIAASRKVAKAGAAAVPAVRAFEQKYGRAQVSQNLVEAWAEEAPVDAPTLQLLVDWANDRDFYWRASALRGIALRLTQAGDRRDELVRLCRSFHDDAAWLMRTHARLGSVLAGDDAAQTLPEDDPRARGRLAMLLLQTGKVPPLQPLLDALADDRSFLDVPWGKQFGELTHKTLKNWLGDDHPLAKGGEFADRATALQQLRDACARKSGQTLAVPAVRSNGAQIPTGWIELLSCKSGDLHLQWTATGEVFVGVDAARKVQVAAPMWDTLSKERTGLELPEALGDVICDSIRLCWLEPKLHCRAAPVTLPAAPANWLKQLAQALEEAGEPRVAATLRAGIEQFAKR